MIDKVAGFLREHLIGRTLCTDPVVYELDGGRLRGTYTDTMQFSGLAVSDTMIVFDMTTVTREQVVAVGGGGRAAETAGADAAEDSTAAPCGFDRGQEVNGAQDGGLVRDYTGTSLFRYRLAWRRSTNTLTGFMQCISTTVKEQTMEAVVYGVCNVRCETDSLRWSERQLMYRDSPVGDGKYTPVAFDSEVNIRTVDGKTVFEYLPAFWDVDPLTMARTPSKDQYPPFVSREK